MEESSFTPELQQPGQQLRHNLVLVSSSGAALQLCFTLDRRD